MSQDDWRGTLFPDAPSSFEDLNIGTVALALNVIVLAIVTAASRLCATAGRARLSRVNRDIGPIAGTVGQ